MAHKTQETPSFAGSLSGIQLHHAAAQGWPPVGTVCSGESEGVRSHELGTGPKVKCVCLLVSQERP